MVDIRGLVERLVAAIDDGRDVDALEAAGVLLRLLLVEQQVGTATQRERFGGAWARLLDRLVGRA